MVHCVVVVVVVAVAVVHYSYSNNKQLCLQTSTLLVNFGTTMDGTRRFRVTYLSISVERD